jgi:hypothetical protein
VVLPVYICEVVTSTLARRRLFPFKRPMRNIPPTTKTYRYSRRGGRYYYKEETWVPDQGVDCQNGDRNSTTVSYTRIETKLVGGKVSKIVSHTLA